MALRYAPAWWGIGVLMLASVLVLSLLPPGDGPPMLLPDKLLHFLTYFLLGVWFVSLAPARPLSAAGAIIAFGGGVELLQGLTETRHAEWLDFVANAAGALLACLAVTKISGNLFLWLEQRLPVFVR